MVLLKLPSFLKRVLPTDRTAAVISLVVVLPTLPVMATTDSSLISPSRRDRASADRAATVSSTTTKAQASEGRGSGILSQRKTRPPSSQALAM